MIKKFLLVCLMVFMCASTLVGCMSEIKVNKTETAEFSENINKISVNSELTDVKIILSKDDKIEANLYGTVSDERLIPKLEVKMENEEVNIKITNPTVTIVGIMNADLGLDVYIPEKYNRNLSIETSSGDVNIESIQLKNFKGKSTSGDLKIDDMIGEEISIETSSGRVTLGDLEASNFKRISTSGDSSIKNIKSKEAVFQSSSGNVEADNIIADVIKGNSTSGDLKINDVIAEKTSIETSSGKVTLGDLEASNFKRISTSGDSSIKNIKSKEVVIESSSGNVEVDKIIADVLKGNSTSGDSYFKDVDSKEVEITATSGNVTFDKLLSNTTKSEGDSGDIKIKKFKGDLLIERSSGKTEVQWIDFNNNVEINSKSGDVILDLPENTQFNVDFKGSSGEYDIDFPITITGKIEDSEIKGSVGDSKNLIKVDTSSGNLTINKR